MVKIKDAALITPATLAEARYNPGQWNSRCRDVEYDAAKCIDAYGYYRSLTMCQNLIEDMLECIHCVKQNKRLEIMHLEYMRQVKNGTKQYMPLPHINYFHV